MSSQYTLKDLFAHYLLEANLNPRSRYQRRYGNWSMRSPRSGRVLALLVGLATRRGCPHRQLTIPDLRRARCPLCGPASWRYSNGIPRGSALRRSADSWGCSRRPTLEVRWHFK